MITPLHETLLLPLLPVLRRAPLRQSLAPPLSLRSLPLMLLPLLPVLRRTPLRPSLAPPLPLRSLPLLLPLLRRIPRHPVAASL